MEETLASSGSSAVSEGDRVSSPDFGPALVLPLSPFLRIKGKCRRLLWKGQRESSFGQDGTESKAHYDMWTVAFGGKPRLGMGFLRSPLELLSMRRKKALARIADPGQNLARVCEGLVKTIPPFDVENSS
ncbi:hypothetical protein ACLOJK_040479 [Asimina triloba]